MSYREWVAEENDLDLDHFVFQPGGLTKPDDFEDFEHIRRIEYSLVERLNPGVAHKVVVSQVNCVTESVDRRTLMTVG